jgi:hypothetical protein
MLALRQDRTGMLEALKAGWRHWFALVRGSGAVELAARIGYASRGAVYLSVGAMALLKAAGLAPHAEGAVGALRAWGQWPVGVVLLWATSLGLIAFAVWRALQSVADVEHLGFSPKAIVTRLGKAISGLVYGGLGVTLLNLLDTLRDLHHPSEQAETIAQVQNTLSLPFGRTLVVTSGLLLLAVGVGNMVRAFFDHFTHQLDCHPWWNSLVGTLARIGYFSRGVAFLPAGALMIAAGWHAHAAEAISIGSSLDLMRAQPFGREILAVQACGLGAFGVYGLVKAVFRRLEMEADG